MRAKILLLRPVGRGALSTSRARGDHESRRRLEYLRAEERRHVGRDGQRRAGAVGPRALQGLHHAGTDRRPDPGTRHCGGKQSLCCAETGWNCVDMGIQYLWPAWRRVPPLVPATSPVPSLSGVVLGRCRVRTLRCPETEWHGLGLGQQREWAGSRHLSDRDVSGTSIGIIGVLMIAARATAITTLRSGPTVRCGRGDRIPRASSATARPLTAALRYK